MLGAVFALFAALPCWVEFEKRSFESNTKTLTTALNLGASRGRTSSLNRPMVQEAPDGAVTSDEVRQYSKDWTFPKRELIEFERFDQAYIEQPLE